MEKRIVIIRNAYSYDFGGGERMPVDLASVLSKNGYHPIIISKSPKLLEYAKSKGVEAVRGWWWSWQNWSGARIVLVPLYLLWQLSLVVWYVGLFIKLRPNVVHAQSKDDFVAATFAGKLLGKRVVWTDHADLKYIFLNHKVWYKNPVGKLVYLASLVTNAISLVSQDEKLSIEKAIGKKLSPKYQVIHNGVADTKVRPKKLKGDGLVFCCTSRLVMAKGIAELIKAFEQVHKDQPSTRLLLVGDGPEAAKFKTMAEGIKNIEFIGHSDEALQFVAAGDIFVHPSYHEGFSLSVVEAAMLAKPIIACSVGGNSEIIRNGHNGLLVPSRDSEALAAAMKKMASDSKLRRRLAKAARQTYEQDFVFNSIVKEKFMPLYER